MNSKVNNMAKMTPEMEALLTETIRILVIDEDIVDLLEDNDIQTIDDLLQTSRTKLSKLGIGRRHIVQILNSLAQRGYK